MKRATAAPVLSLFLALAGMAGSATAQAAKPLDPVGNFEYTTTVDGQPMSGVISIMKKENALTGKIVSEVMPEIAISAVKVEARKVTLTAQIPDGPELVIVLTFEDDNKFAGNWSTGDQSGAISGKRKTS